MDMGFKSIRMVSILVIGKIIKHKGKDYFNTLMGIYIQVNGKMIKYKVMENTKIKMEPYTMECGTKIRKMGEEKKFGLTAQNI